MDDDLQAIARVEELLRARGHDDLADEVYALGCAIGSESQDVEQELRAADRRARESDYPVDAYADLPASQVSADVDRYGHVAGWR